MENKNNEKQLYVQKEPFEYNGKMYNHYYIKGIVRGREVKIDLAPPNKDTDMGGYAVLDIVFGDADRADLIIEPFEITDDKTKQVIKGNRYLVRTVDEDGNTVLISTGGRPTRLQGISLTPDTKRLYPFGSLAGNVIGFVNANNMGAYGLEASYDDVLSGSTGLTITPTNVNGTPLLFSGGEQMFDAENGSSLVLTLDTNVQYALEKGLESMLDKYDAANGGTGIVMDVNTGGIVAMASYPNYDPGDFSTIYTEGLQAELDAALAEIQQNRSTYETEEAYNQALANARATIQFKQWRNKCYQDTYEPGSTFKPITLATALEEGVVNMNTTFTCTGSIHVEGWGKAINCSKRAGHGTQTLKVATGNSCNPAFVTMGLKIGTEVAAGTVVTVQFGDNSVLD